MRRVLNFLLPLIVALAAVSCVDEEEYSYDRAATLRRSGR